MDFTTTLVEIWTLYFVGTVMMAARVFVRTKMVGVRGYSPDDYLVWFAWVRDLFLVTDNDCHMANTKG